MDYKWPISFCGERQAIVEFAKWLNKFPSTQIVANNSQFDAQSLTRHVLIDFINKCLGYSEFLKLSKRVLPNQQSYERPELINAFL